MAIVYSAPGNVLIKTTLMKSLPVALCWHPDCVLVKTSTDNSPGDLVLQETPPGAKRPCAWLVLFLENMLQLQSRSNPVEEIGSQNFYESNLREARFDNSLPFYLNNYGNHVNDISVYLGNSGLT